MELPEDIYHSIVEATPNGMVLFDADGEIVLVNSLAERQFGYLPGELIGQSVDILVPDKNRLAYRKLIFSDPRDHVIGLRLDLFGLRKDSSEFPVEIRLSPVSPGDDTLMLATVIDATGHSELDTLMQTQYAVTEALARAASPDTAWLSTLESICLSAGWCHGALWLVETASQNLVCTYQWNHPDSNHPAFAQSTKDTTFAPGEGLIGMVWQTCEPMWVPDVTEYPGFVRVQAARQDNLRGALTLPIIGSRGILGVMEFFHHDVHKPTTRLLELLSSTGNQIGMFIERLYAEQQRKRTMEELARSNQELEEFAKIASHDLQEPLRSLKGLTNLLVRRLKGKMGEDADRIVDLIDKSAEKMERFIQAVLSHSRAQMDEENLEQTELSSIVASALENLNLDCLEERPEISTGILPALKIDRTLMEQVFQNIISNSLKYKGKDPLHIRIECERTGDEWLFCIKDNGMGFEQKYAEKIFRMFSRLHGDTSHSGSGIGLSICKKVIETHGGRIWAESEPGRGTAISFTLPVRNVA